MLLRSAAKPAQKQLPFICSFIFINYLDDFWSTTIIIYRSTYHIINIFTIFAVLKDRLSMAKNTMGTKLPRKLEEKMTLLGEQIKLARLRRNLSIAQVAERATCSPLTVNRIEKGSTTVSIGIYARVLYALQLDDDLLLIAKEDTLGRNLQDLSLKNRQRASKK